MSSITTAARLQIAANVVQTLHRAAQIVYPEEACGLLVGRWRAGGTVEVTQAVLTPNTAPADERRNRYRIDPRLLLEWDRLAQRSGNAIVGFFHSHPDHEPRPSPTDAATAWPAYVYVIVSAAAPPAGQAQPLGTGMAAWTFLESSTSFAEVPVTVSIEQDQIEYFI